MGNQEATTLAVVESGLLILETEKLGGRETKRPTGETEDINAKAGTGPCLQIPTQVLAFWLRVLIFKP